MGEDARRSIWLIAEKRKSRSEPAAVPLRPVRPGSC
jgi:hypothetical protein